VLLVIKAATAVVNTVKSVASTIMNNPYLKGSASGGGDKFVEKKAKKYIPKTNRGFVSTGKLTIQKYVTTPGVAARVSKVTATKVGAGGIIFTGIDMYKDGRDKKYAGIGIDFLAGLAGVGAGMVLGALGGIAISFGLPVLAVGAGVFVAGVAVGVFIDKGANAIKDWHYRRKEQNGS
jgi:hypothetical protein